MKKVLIINGHQFYENFAEGKLTQSIIDRAKEFFTNEGFEIKETAIDKGYDVEEELDKFSWADHIFFQYPVYWMSVPWKTKKYMDEVFSGGAGTVTYKDDGRSRKDPSKKYGSGGLLKGKDYMLSLTYNCPETEFSNKDGFFEGLSLDEANFVAHKTFQFCGLEPLKTYSIHDVYKGDLDLETELKKLDSVLEKNFK
ncbi:NAD(P)H-dependent oxidoreductase [Halarcobacter sp.]|uniref:NAD(P)H-dependent oxidoreductase n=1 Tax=Halarcobacter sp. TaxID=2321133 RepID=UPI002AA889CA|nr:NAD(P)H-dependent oxidoreductase [Halarcobacter sp.]